MNLTLGAAAAGLGGIAYMRLLEPRWLRVSRVRLRLPGATGTGPIRILHLRGICCSAGTRMAGNCASRGTVPPPSRR
ncbi:MAG: hypothetical protein JXR37_26145 [Kiritimatiellae bacterium]|nr:hypothetical protein [Kiritimatiellia bacterium]